MNKNTNSLTGRKILVTAFDLEQSEHRGIAVFTKALIHCLKLAGAEVWLLTEAQSHKNSYLKTAPTQTRDLVRNVTILDTLAYGKKNQPQPYLQRKLRIANPIRLSTTIFELVIELARRPRSYNKNNLHKFRISQLFDNPYPRVERLNYLKDIEGIVSAPKLFLASMFAARLRQRKSVKIDLRDFDALLTSCPLNISPSHLPIFE